LARDIPGGNDRSYTGKFFGLFRVNSDDPGMRIAAAQSFSMELLIEVQIGAELYPAGYLLSPIDPGV